MSGSARTRTRRLCVVLFFVAVFGALTAGRGWWLPHWARALDVSEPPHKADYAMILGGGANSRAFVAAALWKKGYVREVLVPGVRESPESADGVLLREDELNRRVLLARGVPSRAITVLPGEAGSTADEARALAEFLAGRPNSTVAIVTTSYHTRRARSVFHHFLGERASRIHFISAPADNFDATNWWLTEDGFTAYLSESVKTAYYAVCY